MAEGKRRKREERVPLHFKFLQFPISGRCCAFRSRNPPREGKRVRKKEAIGQNETKDGAGNWVPEKIKRTHENGPMEREFEEEKEMRIKEQM